MSDYFSKVPDFEYVSWLPNSSIGDYVTVKNLFKKGALQEDILNNLALHTKYKIEGDDRPDNVAFEVYEDSTLDWIVLLSNNIINIQTEWPLLQNDFDRFLLDKYGSHEEMHKVHHYETKEIKDSDGVIIVPQGLQVASDYSITYWDNTVRGYVAETDIPEPVTNYDYEMDIENRKRSIHLLKIRYMGIVRDDMKQLMTYKKGSTQYVDKTLKRGENIRLYQ